MKRFALIGMPVSHSRSPAFHNAMFAELGSAEEMAYELLETAPGELALRLDALREGEYAGYSVTIPYKELVMEYCDELSARAEKVGAVNTLIRREDGSIFGDNTDYTGFRESLVEADVLDAGKALVLGAGGAARAVVAVLQDEGYEVIVASRDPEMVVGFSAEISGYDALDPTDDWTLIVNTTPVGMHPKEGESVLEDPEWFVADRVYVDIIYNPRITTFLGMAEAAGGKIVTGERMFYWQALEQAKLFTGRQELPFMKFS